MSDKFQNPVLIDLPLPIITPRLILRPCEAGDGEEIHTAIEESWEQLHQWMPWAAARQTPDQVEASCREAHADFIRRSDLRMNGYERESGRFVIGTGLHRFEWNIRRFEIGYWVRASAQNNGYATEAANALTRYAFEVLNARAVAINVAAGNEPSIKVIEKLGFEKEGTARNDLQDGKGNILDHHHYSRISAESLPDLDVKWG